VRTGTEAFEQEAPISRIGEAKVGREFRRAFLKGVGLTLAAAPLTNVVAGEAPAASPDADPCRAAQGFGTHLLLLVTAGGVVIAGK
jgi:hypothetical protein